MSHDAPGIARLRDRGDRVMAARVRRSPRIMLAMILVAALAIRLVLAVWVYPAQGFASDLRDFQRWATEMLDTGPGTIYARDPGINYPPGYLDVLWGLAWLARAASQSLDTTYAGTLAVMLKLPAMVTDLATGALAYVLGRRLFGLRAGLWAAALVLFVPLTWYDSTVWGQVDSVSAFLMLACLTLLVHRHEVAASAVGACAYLVKPQAVIVLVVVAAVLIRRHALRKERPIVLLAAPAAALATLTLVSLPFDVGVYAPPRLRGLPVVNELGGLFGLFRVATQSFTVLTANAYNVWAMVGPRPLDERVGRFDLGSWTPDSLPTLWGTPALVVGAVLLGTTTLLVVLGLLLRSDDVPILLGFTVLAVAFFAEPTRVHERYMFPAYVSGAVLASGGLLWGAAFLTSGLLTTVNLHGILGTAFGSIATEPGGSPVVGRPATGSPGGTGPPPGGPPGVPPGGEPPGGYVPGTSGASGGHPLPWSSFGRAEWQIELVAIAHTLTMVGLLMAFVLVIWHPLSRHRGLRPTAG